MLLAVSVLNDTLPDCFPVLLGYTELIEELQDNYDKEI